MAFCFVPLLADVDIGELIKLIIIFLIFIVPAIGQIMAKVRRVQPPAGGAKPQRPPAGGVAEEIEQFLRRVAGERQAAKPPAPQRPQQAPVAQAARPPAAKPKGAKPAAKPVLKTPPQTAQAPAGTARPVVGQIEEHVKQRLSTDKLQARTQRLGVEVAQADRQIEQHLHKVFDHDLSRLPAAPSGGEAAGEPPAQQAPEVPPTLAAGLPALLSSGMAISQAIVLSEIIRRPEERWE